MKKLIIALILTLCMAFPLGAETLRRNETVYVSLDAYGKQNRTEVVTWLRTDGQAPSADMTDLRDVENIKGRELSIEDGRLLFDKPVRDIFYRGYTDRALPVSFDISYELDGQSVRHDELAGRQGRLTIKVKLHNNTAAIYPVSFKPMGAKQASVIEEELITPFMTIAAINFGIDQIADLDTIEAPGSMSMVAGSMMVFNWMVLPAPDETLSLSLDVENLKAPTLIFSLIPGLPELPMDADVSQLGELYSGIGQISDGIARVQNGLYQLADGQQQVGSGIKEAADGARGLSQLADGHREMLGNAMDANRQMVSGLNEHRKTPIVGNVVKQVIPGLNAEQELMKLVYEGGELSAEMKRMAAERGETVEVDEMPGLDTSADGLRRMGSGLDQAVDGLVQISDGTRRSADGLGQIRKEGLQRMQRELKLGMGPLMKQLTLADEARKLGDAYDRFAGKPSAVKSDVQFIIKAGE